MNYSNICTNCFKLKGNTAVCPHCGQVGAQMPEEAYHLNPGTILNARYLVGKVLGFGGFGVIYMALDLKLSRVVAIKEFFPTSLVTRVPGELAVSIFSGEKAAEYNKGLSRFLEEARNIAMFEKSPYIVKVMEVFTGNRTAYIVMEYIEGFTLGQLISNNNGRLPYKTAVEIIISVLNGLEALHEKKIYHRDINPKNIMIDKNNHIKLIDFGTAEFYEEKEKTLSKVVTGGYAAPEQYRDISINGAYTDIYAVGATLYKAIVGVKPIDAPDRLKNDTLQKPSEFIPDLPKNVDIAIMTALAIKHEQRFQSTDAMINALVAEELKIDYPEIEEKKRIRKRNITVLSALAAILAAVVVILFATQKSDPLFKPMKSVILKSETIELYVPYSTAEEKTKLESNLNKLKEDFRKEVNTNYGKDINVTVHYVSKDKYSEEISNSIGTDHEACLFRTDVEDINGIEYASLENLYNNIKDDMVLSEKYEEIYGSTYTTMPMSFYFYLMYYNTDNTYGIDSTNSWSDFTESAPDDKMIVLSDTATPALYSALKDDSATLDVASDVLFRTMKDGKLPEKDTARDLFLKSYEPARTIKSYDTYLGTSKDAGIFKSNNVMYYIASRNIIGCGDNWYGQFDWEWSVSDDVSDSKRDASILFLRYCMSTEAQYDLTSAGTETETVLSLNKVVLSSQLKNAFIEVLPEESVEKMHIISDDSENTEFSKAFIEQGRKTKNTKETIKTFSKKYF